jgi:hypothetical protein
MAAPFWRGPAGIGIFWIFLSALIEGIHFFDPEAVLNPGTAPAEGFRPF